MKTLYEYITESQSDDRVLADWDGHVHLFNHKEPIPSNHGFAKCVGFMDIEYDVVNNIKVVDSYTNYIKNHLNRQKTILLATGVTFEDIKSVYEKYPKTIKGFGELKCYDMYRGEKVPYKKISFVNSVVKFSHEHGCLPVYIHWELNSGKDVEKLENTLNKYPGVPIVLCHMGMTETNRDFAFMAAMRLQQNHSNLWLDISWDAADYIRTNPMRINNLIMDRIILGTDLNNKIFDEEGWHKSRGPLWGLEAMVDIKEYGQIDNKKNIKKLFNIC